MSEFILYDILTDPSLMLQRQMGAQCCVSYNIDPLPFLIQVLTCGRPMVRWTTLLLAVCYSRALGPGDSSCTSVGMEGCLDIVVTVVDPNVGKQRTGWAIVEVCPPLVEDPGTINTNRTYSTSLCLPPGQYTLTEVGTHGKAQSWFSVSLGHYARWLMYPTILDAGNRTFTVAAGGSCSDAPFGWADTDVDDCTAYSVQRWCTEDGQHAPSWGPVPPTFEDYAVGGTNAVEACCGCGGGQRGDPCKGRATTVDVPGCVAVVVTVTTSSDGMQIGWALEGACPAVGRNPGTLGTGVAYTTTVCLVPGPYAFVLWDTYGSLTRDRGRFRVVLEGDGLELVPETTNKRWSARHPFVVGTVSPTFSASDSLTPSPSLTTNTLTPTPTATSRLPECEPLAQYEPGDAVALFVAGGKCMARLPLGAGSDALVKRSVALGVQQLLEGRVVMQLQTGCTAQAPGCPDCEPCMLHFVTQGVHTGLHNEILPLAQVPRLPPSRAL